MQVQERNLQVLTKTNRLRATLKSRIDRGPCSRLFGSMSARSMRTRDMSTRDAMQEKLARAPGAGWVLDFSAGFVKALGAVEILGAVGLILPALLDIAPNLVPLAAVGLALIMVGATIVTLRRHEFKHVLLNLTYLALAAFVAWGRFSGK